VKVVLDISIAMLSELTTLLSSSVCHYMVRLLIVFPFNVKGHTWGQIQAYLNTGLVY
jgi:hypothetical protein